MAQLRTQKDLEKLVKEGAPVAGVSFGEGLTFTSSDAQIARAAGTWVFRYRHAGRQKESTLGNYPDMPLERSKARPEIKSAREVARAMRVMVDLGRDVADEKRRTKAEAASASTFREVAEKHLEAMTGDKAPRTIKEWRQYLDKDILPRLGSMAIRDVSPEDVVSIVERVGQRSKTVAGRTFQILSVIFTHALAKRSATQNPCAGLKVSAIIGGHQKRKRVKLERDELVALLQSAPQLGRINTLIVKILLATCVRKGELIKAKKTDLDFGARLWTIPDENSKTRKGFQIPLAPAVAEWFRELLTYAGSSEWVLPARQGPGRLRGEHMHERTLNAALSRSKFGITAFTPHDLRSTARSHLTSRAIGVSLIVAERCLNHSLGGLVAVYDQHDYLDERREALEKWAQYLVELEQGNGNVVPLRAAA